MFAYFAKVGRVLGWEKDDDREGGEERGNGEGTIIEIKRTNTKITMKNISKKKYIQDPPQR